MRPGDPLVSHRKISQLKETQPTFDAVGENGGWWELLYTEEHLQVAGEYVITKIRNANDSNWYGIYVPVTLRGEQEYLFESQSLKSPPASEQSKYR
jgi:hypothetical protein